MLSHAVLVLCSVDLPVQSIVLNMKQFHGRFACNFCEHEGVSTEEERKGESPLTLHTYRT